MSRNTFFALVTTGLLAACASTPVAKPGPPNYAEIDTQPAPAHARLYVDCFGEAFRGNAYRRAANGGDELLLFTCTGPAAGALFAALEPWSTRIGSEWRTAGRVWRSTARVQRDLVGVDYCSAAPDGRDARCVITFNAGDFLDP